MIVNPISAYRTFQKSQPEGRRRHLRDDAAEGTGAQDHGRRSEFYGIWKFAKNKEGAIEFLKYYADHWPEAFKASEGYNNPCFASLVPKPMPILSNDPTSTPHDKFAVLQSSEQWSAAPGIPGRRGRRRRGLQRLRHLRHDGEDGDRSDVRRGLGQMGHTTKRSHLQEVAECLASDPTARAVRGGQSDTIA